MNKRALLLIGSPKPASSTSEAVGDYLLDKLRQYDIKGEKIKLIQILKQEDGINELISAINNCDILILSSPLYLDSAPAIVTKAMELISNDRIAREHIKRPIMLAICNSGFPEAHQNHTALSIYRHFANASSFEWAGGLALGGGGSIDSRPINSLGGMVRNVVKSLDLTASAIADGKHIPEEAIKLMAKPFVPHWLYFIFGQFGWRIQAKKYGAQKNLNDRPYEVN